MRRTVGVGWKMRQECAWALCCTHTPMQFSVQSAVIFLAVGIGAGARMYESGHGFSVAVTLCNVCTANANLNSIGQKRRSEGGMSIQDRDMLKSARDLGTRVSPWP